MQTGQIHSASPASPAAGPRMAHRIWIYFWGAIGHPARTFERLAQERSLLLAAAPFLIYLALAFLNSLLRTAVHGPQIGTEPMLPETVFVGGFGYWVLNQTAYRAGWGVAFVLYALPAMWVLLAGIAQTFGLLWRGKGSFESGLMTLSYALFVPWILIQSTSEILFGVPLNLLTGTAFFWSEAMIGRFGPAVSLIWNAFVIGIYSFVTYGWSLALIYLAIRRTQGLSRGKSIVSSLAGFFAVVFLFSIFVR